MNLPIEFSIKKEIENVFGRRIVSSGIVYNYPTKFIKEHKPK